MAAPGRKRAREDNDRGDGYANSFKRGRYSDPGRGPAREPESTEKRLENFITRVGEKGQSPESSLETLAALIQEEIVNYKEKILKTICNCVGTLCYKTTIYSTLVGIINARKYDFGEEVVDMIVEDLKSALNVQDFEKAKNLVRFLADLVNSKVVVAGSLLSLFEAFITVTFEPGENSPQLRSDWYVYAVLAALPWVGQELQAKKPQELERLLGNIESYINKRNTAYLPALQVWTTEHPHAQRDYLVLLWIQVKNMKESGWKEKVLERPYQSFETEIGGAFSHSISSIIVPSHTPGAHYPLPTAVFRIFGVENIVSEYALPPEDFIDRYLAEEIVRCTVQAHSSNRKECAAELVGFVKKIHLTMEYIITEVLFGYIFQLPCPPQVMICYGSLFIELCKSSPNTFPQLLLQTSPLVYSRLEKMNSVCLNRFARWFAYHLSNFKYQWDWSIWSSCLDASADHPSIRFVGEVISRCIRLSCYEEFIELVPSHFSALIPPEPLPLFKYSEENGAALPEYTLSTQLLEAIRSKESTEKLSAILDSLPTVCTELEGNDAALLETKVSLLTHCVLHVGSKTISHCTLALYKFRPLFLELLKSDAAKLTCLKSAAEFYATNPQLLTLVVDKMLRMQIVDSMAVIEQFVWDVVESTLLKQNRAYAQANKELTDVQEELRKVSDLDAVALGGETRQDLERKRELVEEKVEECERAHMDVFVALCRNLVHLLGSHLVSCALEKEDHETPWFCCTLDCLRQLLVQHYSSSVRYHSTLESTVFTPNVDSRVSEVFIQFQALV
ncbi:hypothetical protein EMCRGX_G022489 [Ephydatia muelleri]